MAYTDMNSGQNLTANIGGMQDSLLKLLRKPVVYHSLFWTLYFIFNVFRWGSYNQDYLYAFYNNLIEFPMHIGLAYLNIYYLIPRYLPKKYFQYVFLVSIGVLVAVGGRILLESVFGVSPNNSLTTSQYVLELVIGEVYVQGFITAFKLLLDWGRNQKRMRELQRSKFRTELDFLRSQVQPHFFFNTLNNLYSLTLDKSDMAPETVLKLSELMSYVIYDGKQKKVHLSKEIGYIQNYLDLERLRFGRKLKTTFDVHGQVSDQRIAPLLMLPFIENSFKHGVGDGIEEVQIDIKLQASPYDIIFTVQNRKFNKIDTGVNGHYHHIGHNGVGIKNVKRRLNLIYGNNYTLNILDEPEKYSVTLKIPTYEN